MFHRFTVHLFGHKDCLRLLMSGVKGTLNFFTFIIRGIHLSTAQIVKKKQVVPVSKAERPNL